MAPRESRSRTRATCSRRRAATRRSDPRSPAKAPADAVCPAATSRQPIERHLHASALRATSAATALGSVRVSRASQIAQAGADVARCEMSDLGARLRTPSEEVHRLTEGDHRLRPQARRRPPRPCERSAVASCFLVSIERASSRAHRQLVPGFWTSAGRYPRAMVLKRVIPCLDVDAGRVVKGTNFVDIRDAGDPVELAERYDAEGADELVFLDITASHESRDTIVELARRTADNVFIPFTIGGGIRSVEDAQAVLDAGADKVSVNSAALDRPELIARAGRGVRRPVRGDRDRRQARGAGRVLGHLRGAAGVLRDGRVGRLRPRRPQRRWRAARPSPGRRRRPSLERGRCC